MKEYSVHYAGGNEKGILKATLVISRESYDPDSDARIVYTFLSRHLPSGTFDGLVRLLNENAEREPGREKSSSETG